MKSLKFIVLLVILALPLSFISAEDDVEEAVWSGSYTISVESGNFVEEDDTYVLVLNDVPTRFAWVVTLPERFAGLIPTIDLMGAWTFQPELTAKAVISTDNETIVLTIGLLSDLPYDFEAGTLTFSAVIEEIVPTDPEIEASKAKLPEEFEFATLFITLDEEFVTGIAVGADLRAQGTRGTGVSQTCTPMPANNWCK